MHVLPTCARCKSRHHAADLLFHNGLLLAASQAGRAEMSGTYSHQSLQGLPGFPALADARAAFRPSVRGILAVADSSIVGIRDAMSHRLRRLFLGFTQSN